MQGIINLLYHNIKGNREKLLIREQLLHNTDCSFDQITEELESEYLVLLNLLQISKENS